MASIVISPEDIRSLRKTKRISPFMLLIISTSLVLLFYFVATALFIPAFVINSISIQVEDVSLKEQIVNASGVFNKLNYLSLDCSTIETALERIPKIKTATVEKVFPNGISIKTSLRSPCAYTIVVIDKKSVMMAIDSDGVIYDTIHEVQADLPFISGLQFEKAVVGLKLPDFVLPLFTSLSELESTNKELLALISEIRIVMTGSKTYDLILYPRNYKIPLRTGPILYSELLSSCALVLDVINKNGTEVDEIDFRKGAIVYRKKGGSS